MMEFINAYYEPLIFTLLGIVGVCYGLLKKQQKTYLLKNGIKTTGIVVDHELSRGSGSSKMSFYYPIIEFEDSEGKLRRLKFDSGFNFKIFKQRQQIEIYYDASNPNKFIINDNNTKLFYYFPFIIGTLFFLVGYIFL